MKKFFNKGKAVFKKSTIDGEENEKTDGKDQIDQIEIKEPKKDQPEKKELPEKKDPPENNPRKSIIVKTNPKSNSELLKAVKNLAVKNTSLKNLNRESFKISEKDYKFSTPDSEENIKYVQEQGKNEIKNASLEKLVEKATFEGHPDPQYLQAFLLTYRSFTNPIDFLKLLANRFQVPVPQEAKDQKEIEEFKKSKQKPIQLRVFNTIKTWVTHYFYDFRESPQLVEAMRHFCEEVMAVSMESASKQVISLIEKGLNTDEKSARKLITTKDIPRPHIPEVKRQLTFGDIHPQEIARQLTIIEAKFYRDIKPWECLGQGWTKKDKMEKSPHVIGMITFFNQVSNFMASEVVASKSLKKRIASLTRCLQVMHYLEELNNFNGMMEIISGLQSSGVFRLKDTWGGLNAKWKRRYEEMAERMSRDKNFQNFRGRLKTISPPCIPYLGMYLTDLTFIEDGHKDIMEDGLINFVKRRQVASVIREIQQYQQTPYFLQSVPVIKDFLKKLDPLSEDKVYELSIAIIPRGGEKEIDIKDIDEKTTEKPVRQSTVTEIDFGELSAPYLFNLPDSDECITFEDDENQIVEAASLSKLVERLTFEKSPEQNFARAFMLTFESFTNNYQLLDLLIARFNIPNPKNTDPKLLQEYEGKKVRPIRLRTFNILKQWINNTPNSFVDKELAKKLKNFCETTMSKAGMDNSSKTLLKFLENCSSDIDRKKPAKTNNKPLPTPLVPKQTNINELELTDIEPEELARQITIKEFMCYSNIDPYELVKVASLKDYFDGKTVTDIPSVLKYLVRNDEMERWYANHIFTCKDESEAVKVIEHLVKVAKFFKELNNFSSVCEVIKVLSLPSVQSLENVWINVSPKTTVKIQKFNEFVKDLDVWDRSQQWMKKVDAPAIPNLRTCINQLIRLNDANQDFIDTKLINFSKRRKISDVIHDTLQFQSSNYQLQILDIVHEFVSTSGIPPMDQIVSSSVLFSERSNGTLTVSKLKGKKKETVRVNTVPNLTEEKIETRTSVTSNSFFESPTTSSELEKNLIQLLNSNSQFSSLLQKKFSSGGDPKLGEKVNKLEKQLESLIKSESTAHHLLQEKFKSMKQSVNINDFSKQDDQGVVYGWPTKINLYQIKFGGTNCVVDGKGFVSLHDLSIYVKKFQFYSKNNQVETKNVVIANSVEDGVEEKCNEFSISLWFVESSPSTILKLI